MDQTKKKIIDRSTDRSLDVIISFYISGLLHHSAEETDRHILSAQTCGGQSDEGVKRPVRPGVSQSSSSPELQQQRRRTHLRFMGIHFLYFLSEFQTKTSVASEILQINQVHSFK